MPTGANEVRVSYGMVFWRCGPMTIVPDEARPSV
jgi:hypothetical protein